MKYGCLFCQRYLDLDPAYLCRECGPNPPSQERGSVEGADSSGSNSDLGAAGNKQPVPTVPSDKMKESRKRAGESPPETPVKKHQAQKLEDGELEKSAEKPANTDQEMVDESTASIDNNNGGITTEEESDS